MKKHKKFLATVLAAAFLLTAGGCGSEGAAEDNTSQYSDGKLDLNSTKVKQKTAVIQDLINKHFLYDIDPAKQEEAYYDSLLRGLDDKYAVYYTPQEYAHIMEDDAGEYVGIGVTVSKSMENGAVYVVEPIEGSPAEALGFEADDIFVEVDGVALTAGMELEEVVKKIRGKEGTKVHVKIYRQSEEDFKEFDVERKKIENKTVKSEMLENGYGYIKVSEFILTTCDQFKEAVDSLVAKGAKGLILDVRNNPGGFTDTVIKMVDYLIEDGQVPKDGDPSKPGVLLEMKDKNSKVLYDDYTKDKHSVDLPMAILMNGNSASSSEIMVGALRDYGKVIMVGEKTYGKGIVQQTFPLSDGSAVKMTIAEYYLPSGSNIHETGIKPDIEVDLTTEQKRILYKLPHNEDPQLAAAIKALGAEPLPGSENLEIGTTETKKPGWVPPTEEPVTETTEEPRTKTTEE